MRHLWIHRDVEVLQGYITRYACSPYIVNRERLEIQWQWNKIKDEMEKTLKELDTHMASKIEWLNEQKK